MRFNALPAASPAPQTGTAAFRSVSEPDGQISDQRVAALARLLADIAALGPAISARAAEIEAARRMPPDLVEALRAIGVFRCFVPRSHGGLELDLAQGLEVIKALARIESSVGWISNIAGGCSIFVALLPLRTYALIHQDGPDVITAGSMMPVGTAEAVGGGWRVNGRWPYASGCEHADWIMAACVLTSNGEPLPGPAEGVPRIRVCVLRAQDWVIEDTWHVAGLGGTGSHHVVLKDALVPDAQFFAIDNVPCIRGPLYGSVREFLPLMHGAAVLGIAEGALAALVELADGGRRPLDAAAPIQHAEMFHRELGRIEAELRAAQAFHAAQVATHWRHACAGTLKDNAALHMQGLQAGIWVAQACVRVADACFALGGAGALYDSSPLQRRMRDMRAAAQHAAVQQRHYTAVGAHALLAPAS
jgi:alkylation response protein AidB-like acyl-CoA dehydrogenase